MEMAGKTIKFTIKGLDCYLKTGEVDEQNQKDFPHLGIGECCHLDLTISRWHEEMRAYEVLMEMANLVIHRGGTARDVADILNGHQFEPSGWVKRGEQAHAYRSICDFVGKYILEEYYRENFWHA